MIHISIGGPTRLIVDGKNRAWYFEDHPHFGPAVSDRKGNIKEDQPPESSPFWAAVSYWHQQGKVISDTGLCVWMTPPKPKLVRIGGKNYALEGSALAEKYGAQDGQS